MKTTAMNRTWKMFACVIVPTVLLAGSAVLSEAGVQENLPYTTYPSFADLMAGTNAQYPKLIRISEPGTKESPNYTGFFFYQCLQFDPIGSLCAWHEGPLPEP